jgi:hypothetical protein
VTACQKARADVKMTGGRTSNKWSMRRNVTSIQAPDRATPRCAILQEAKFQVRALRRKHSAADTFSTAQNPQFSALSFSLFIIGSSKDVDDVVDKTDTGFDVVDRPTDPAVS